MSAASAEVRMLDAGYQREACSLLYHAYRHEPTFAYLLEATRSGFDSRVRATVRELVNQHFAEELPAIGVLINERLLGIALIAPPQRCLGLGESWSWQLRMLLGIGLRCTRRYLDYHAAVQTGLPPGPFHRLPLLGIHPEFQGQHLGAQLLQAVHAWCDEDDSSQGVVLDTGNPQYLAFYRRLGYQEIGAVAVGPIIQYLLLHAHSPVPASA